MTRSGLLVLAMLMMRIGVFAIEFAIEFAIAFATDLTWLEQDCNCYNYQVFVMYYIT